MKMSLVVFIAGVFALFISPSRASITINFSSDIEPPYNAGSGHQVNTTANGFRISPECHFDDAITISGVIPAISWDCAGGANPAYLGPADAASTSSLYLDAFGKLFSLISADIFAPFPLTITSSKGGVFDSGIVCCSFVEFNFSDPEWTGVQWLLFSYTDVGAPGSGFDQLVLSEPVIEPSTIAILACGLIVLGLGFYRPSRSA